MENKDTHTDKKQSSPFAWGRWVFALTLVATLVFFWWLLIYSHGVTPHHG